MGLLQDLKTIKTLPQTLLILGRSTTGKTTQAVQRVKDKQRVVWSTYTNLDTLFNSNLQNDVKIMPEPSYDELLTSVQTVKAFAPDAIVIDGLDVLSRRTIDYLARDKVNPSQSDWAVMGRMVDNILAAYKSLSPVLIATVNVVEVSDKEGRPTGSYDLAVNRDLYNRIMPHFFGKIYCSTIANPKSGELIYQVQENSALAVKLIPPPLPTVNTNEPKKEMKS